MGRITIEIPQKTDRFFDIKSPENAETILRTLEEIIVRERADDDDILGVWSQPDQRGHAGSPI